jgi:hypothetical protein
LNDFTAQRFFQTARRMLKIVPVLENGSLLGDKGLDELRWSSWR